MINKIPLVPLVVLALTLGLAPYLPMPHLQEKLLMLLHGSLHRAVDIFDLLLHAAPFILLIVRLGSHLLSKAAQTED